MTRRSSFGDKLARELRRLVVTLVFVVAALWLGFFVLPDVLTALFLDAMDLPPAP